MAGDWRDDDRYGRRNIERERSWREGQRDRESESRDYGSSGMGSRGYGQTRDNDRSYGRGEDWGYGNPNPGRFGSEEERNYNWSGGGGYGGGYGGSRSSGYGRGMGGGYGAGQQQSDYPDYGWASSRWDAGRGYGRESGYGSAGYGSSYAGSGRGGYGGQYGGNQERGFWDRATDEVSSWFGDEEAERRRRMDQMQGGQHRGRGPKGYTRSDDRIREDVSDALSDDPMVDASEITVSVSNCEVMLTGTVDSRLEKRRAEDCAERISGVKHVQNNLRVNEPMTTTAFGTTGGTRAATTTAGSSTTTKDQKV